MRCLAWQFEEAVIAYVVEDWYGRKREYISRTTEMLAST